MSIKYPAAAAVVVGARINYLSPIKLSALKCTDKHFGCRYICGNGHIVNVAHTEKICSGIGRVGALGHRAAKIKEDINFIIRYSRGNLLLSAVLSGKQSLNFEAGSLRNIPPGSTRCTYVMF